MQPRSRWGALLALALFLAPRAAAAQAGCPDPTSPGPIEATPAASAQGVTRDARVRVLYTRGYFAPGGPSDGSETLRVFDPLGVEIDGTTSQVGGDALFFVPSAPLEPFTTYRVVATGIASTLELTFTTGASFDVEPPAVGSFSRVSVDPVGPSCEAPEGGYRVGVSFFPAQDDGALGSLEYGVFLIRGPGVTAPVRVARQRHFGGASEITVAFVLTPAQAESIVCVGLRVEDGVGRATEGEGICFDPVTGTAFEPLCAVAAPGASAGAGGGLVPLAVAAAGVARRRRRRRP